MSLRAGLAETDITPEVPIEKVGWLRRITADRVLDPLYVKVLLLESSGTRIGFAVLDVLSVTSSVVERIREIGRQYGIPPKNLMVAATHNHAGPAVCTVGDSLRDDAYLSFMFDCVEKAIGAAEADLKPVQIGVTSGIEGRLAFVRRYIMKDGSTKTHPPICSPEIRFAETVADPELGVVALRNPDGAIRGFVVNFACHPTHHGGDNCLSGGYPGRLSAELKNRFGPRCVTVFLNGAFGNMAHINPLAPNGQIGMDYVGKTLAEDVAALVPEMKFSSQAALSAKSVSVEVPLRDVDGPYGAKAKNAQPFGTEKIYEESRRRIRMAGKRSERADVQSLFIGNETAFVAIPAEYFVQLGLRIKKASSVRNTYVAAAANGMLGYVPHKEAFEPGGYETTLAEWSKVAPGTGEILADAAINLLGQKETRQK